MNAARLRCELEERKLPSSGSKEQLVVRLRDALSKGLKVDKRQSKFVKDSKAVSGLKKRVPGQPVLKDAVGECPRCGKPFRTKKGLNLHLKCKLCADWSHRLRQLARFGGLTHETAEYKPYWFDAMVGLASHSCVSRCAVMEYC